MNYNMSGIKFAITSEICSLITQTFAEKTSDDVTTSQILVAPSVLCLTISRNVFVLCYN